VAVQFGLILSSFLAKLMPFKLEASIFALLSSSQNLTYNNMGSLEGVLINDYLISPPI
jgi:hypothetical protein